MPDVTAIDRLYDALTRGDVAAARACFVPHARVWHSYDGLAVDLDASVAGWQGLVAHFPERSFEDVRDEAIEGGLLRRHVMVGRRSDGARAGERLAWPICLVVRLEDGLISRIDEYIDRAGSLSVPDGPVRTPGL